MIHGIKRTFFVFILTPIINASAMNSPAGKYKIKHLNLPEEAMIWTIKSLNDSDPNYAPSISVQFLLDDETVIYSFGIVKTDGEQGISSYLAVGGPDNTIKRSAVVTNLEFNKTYEFSYSFTRDEHAKFIISGKEVNTGVPVMPAAVRLVISGMEVFISSP